MMTVTEFTGALHDLLDAVASYAATYNEKSPEIGVLPEYVVVLNAFKEAHAFTPAKGDTDLAVLLFDLVENAKYERTTEIAEAMGLEVNYKSAEVHELTIRIIKSIQGGYVKRENP